MSGLRTKVPAPGRYLLALVVLSFAFRAPALVNAGTVDSDAAIVGLQARHLLHGLEGGFSFFLYGSGYQTSVDSWVAAAFFAALGATPLALVLSTLTGHVVATCAAFLTLARHVSRGAAFVAALPLVFTSSPLHTYILNPPRQASLTLVFVAVYVLDGAPLAPTHRSRLGRLAAGGACASLACFADPYALLFLPPLLAFGALDRPEGVAVVSGWGRRLRLFAPGALATLAGAAAGLVPFALLVTSAAAVHGETRLTPSVLGHNLALLVDPCLPWLLGAAAYVPRALLGYVRWEPGAIVRALQLGGACTFLALVAMGGVSAVRGRAAWSVRRLGGFGCGVALLTVGSFLLSVMVMDLFSSRYLAALVLVSPFALAPAAARLGWRALLPLLAPYLIASGVAGWLGFGDAVRGPRVVTLPGGGARDERALEAMLVERGIHAAVADYWVSYRLTFLFEEAVVVVPIHAREDRYHAYRDAYATSRLSAYVFDPKRSREELGAMETEAFRGDHPWGVPVERLHAGALTAIVFERPSS